MISRIRSYFKRIKVAIKNVVRWYPTISKDQDWDYYYIYQILKQKLEFQKEYISKHSLHKSFLRDIETIDECLRLIDIVQNEKYINEAIENDYDDHLTDKAITRHNEARRQLFKKIEENIEFWWD